DDEPDVAGANDIVNATAITEPEAAAPPETTPDPDDDSAAVPDEAGTTPSPVEATQAPEADVEPTEELPPPVLVEADMIAFTSARDGSLNLYVVSPDGTRVNLLISESGDDWSPAWSNDGTRIAWNSKVGGYDQIFVA